MSREYKWDYKKNEKLKTERNISFEDILIAIRDEKVLLDEKHPTRLNQRKIVVFCKNYTYSVPYVVNNNVVFFKTIYPSRKYAKIFLKHEK